MNVSNTKAAKLSRYHFGYVGALEDAAHMSRCEVEDAMRKAERYARLNREKRNTDAAHLYEGKSKGYSVALRGI